MVDLGEGRTIFSKFGESRWFSVKCKLLYGIDGEQGEQGPKGDKGDAPIKGVDYWTKRLPNPILTNR